MARWTDAFELPNGSQLKNRVAKAALEEKMADISKRNQPSTSLLNLYQRWGEGGSGLILSGHIMIDPKAMAAPGDVLLAEDAPAFDEKIWREWIEKTQKDGAQFWFQINHPGRQIPKGSGLPTYGPSAIPLKGALSRMFDTPIAMTEEQIQDVIRRFAWTAQKAEQLGASGIEIHAAHGYLISQFLSPLSNQRTDRWGGSLENRSRLLLNVVEAVRAKVSPKFGVGVKINSADFQRGGFDEKELWSVVEMLNGKGLDLIELSGGSYEAPVMSTGPSDGRSARTLEREAYFLQAARQIKDIATMPVMVTGGISTLRTLETVIGSSDSFIAGVGTALGLLPDLPKRWMAGEDPGPSVAQSWVLKGIVYAGAKIAAVQYNMRCYGAQSQAWPLVWPIWALLTSLTTEAFQGFSYKRLASSTKA